MAHYWCIGNVLQDSALEQMMTGSVVMLCPKQYCKLDTVFYIFILSAEVNASVSCFDAQNSACWGLSSL